MISSDRAFSLPLAVARGRFSARIAVRISLGAMGVAWGRNWMSSIVVSPKAVLTEPIVLKSL